MMWYWGSGGVQWWGWVLMSLGMVVFWSLVIWAIWYFVTGLTKSAHLTQRPTDAKAILDERLARGEIDPAEYGGLREVMRDDQVHTGNGRSPVKTGGQA